MSTPRSPDAALHNPEPAYLRELLEKGKLSQSEAAVLIDINPRSMRRYLDGTTQIPYVVQFAIECLVDSVLSRRPNKQVLKRTKTTDLKAMLDTWQAEQAQHVAPAAGYKRATEYLATIYAELARRANGHE